MLALRHKHFSSAYITLAQAYAADLPPFQDSRTGRVRDLGPVALELESGGNRLALVNGRALNPFFAFAEAACILAGRADVAAVQPFVSWIEEYSDDGVTFNGAYGHRLRHYFGQDQIERAISILEHDPSSRRVVLALWSADDLGTKSLDLPCNIACALKIVDNSVAITVFNRSNDYFRGYAYDVFAFTGVQSYFALRLGLATGRYVHMTDSLHVYERDHRAVLEIGEQNDPAQLALALDSLPRVPACYTFCGIAVPYAPLSEPGVPSSLTALERSFTTWKAGRFQEAIDAVQDSEPGLAAVLYLHERRAFASCRLPAWFETRATHGPWRMR